METGPLIRVRRTCELRLLRRLSRGPLDNLPRLGWLAERANMKAGGNTSRAGA